MLAKDRCLPPRFKLLTTIGGNVPAVMAACAELHTAVCFA